jgi:hypothetical protein
MSHDRIWAAKWVLGAAAVFAVGCTAPNPAVPAEQTPSSAAVSATAAPPSAPFGANQIDAGWMGFETSQPWQWEEVERRATSDFQQFGFRPFDETEVPRGCNHCGTRPETARMTVYAAGRFDPTEASDDQPVSVLGGDGFFRAADGSRDAKLTWQYAKNAWATLRGRTTATSDVARMLDLARALRPSSRTPIRVPLSLTKVPAGMPLAQIYVDERGYGTTFMFADCVMTDVGAVPPGCKRNSDWLRVQIWPTDGYDGHIDEQGRVAWRIGGKDGVYNKATNQAAVQVQRGLLVVFVLGGPYGSGPTVNGPTNHLEEILATVDWASDPGDDATWRPVAEWAK